VDESHLIHNKHDGTQRSCSIGGKLTGVEMAHDRVHLAVDSVQEVSAKEDLNL